jgi:hypothetical protein
MLRLDTVWKVTDKTSALRFKKPPAPVVDLNLQVNSMTLIFAFYLA